MGEGGTGGEGGGVGGWRRQAMRNEEEEMSLIVLMYKLTRHEK